MTTCGDWGGEKEDLYSLLAGLFQLHFQQAGCQIGLPRPKNTSTKGIVKVKSARDTLVNFNDKKVRTKVTRMPPKNKHLIASRDIACYKMSNVRHGTWLAIHEERSHDNFMSLEESRKGI
ncbi:hypothetical protein DdX_05896 [Ditylenchus destructor]|uniref:Uncharacterized protein n=1 Tax=Ditylenchus destructor TaxID=166010 RepID=A0AAD4N594_9BILA|nr:hypothetical protein DdX_05896 [Ditylenchus destructor]